MDEPLASLDGPRKAEILPYLERLRDEMQMPILYVSHDMSEVARLANSLILMGEGRVVQAGPAQDLLADPGLVPYLDPQEAGAVLSAKVRSYHSGDDLTELALSAGTLVLPGRQGTVGDVKRVRVAAQDVILATTKPVGTSALNILPVTVTKLQSGRGPGVAVGLLSGTDELLARVTRRSAQVLDLSEGSELFAILKATAVAPRDVN
jgi:molybdate transport system ATP-binding protein